MKIRDIRIHIPLIDLQIGIKPVIRYFLFALELNNPVAHQRLVARGSHPRQLYIAHFESAS